MKLLTNTKNWNCTIASAAMVMDCSIEDLEELIGHDGSEIIFPEYREPGNRKGFHMQEVIDVALRMGFTVTPIEVLPRQCVFEDGAGTYTIFTDEEAEKRLRNHFSKGSGIIIGQRRSGLCHAVAWDHNTQTIYDPNGRTYTLDNIKNFDIKIFWRFDKILSIK